MSTSTDRSHPKGTLPPAERAAAFSATSSRIPLRVVLIFLSVAVGLTLLGILGEDLFSKAGLNPKPPRTSPVIAPPASVPAAHQLSAPLPAFMGIEAMRGSAAPPISLLDQAGTRVSLAGERGRVVVVSFFNASCTDICPVLAAEIAQAEAALGRAARDVTFLTVNTDPVATAVGPATPAVAVTPLSRHRNWYLLGGTRASLEGVWRNYGVTVIFSPSTGIVTHNDIIYFIDMTGRLRYRAVPYANEDTAGAYSLPVEDIDRWGAGIAEYVRRLLPPSR